MRFKFFTGLLAIFLVAQKISAQKDTVVYFFNKDLQPTEGENNAIYIGKAFEQKPFWKLIIANHQTGSIILRSNYSDSNLTQLEADYEVFFDNGKPKMTGYYQAGIENGIWKTWNEKNILTDSIVYKNGEILFRENSVYNDHGILTSYSLNDNVTKRKINRNYFPTGRLKDSSTWIDKKGELRLYYETGSLAQLAKFDEKGKRIFFEYYKEDGTVISEKEYSRIFEKKLEDLRQQTREAMPEYLGGEGQLGIFFQKNLKLPASYTNSIHQTQKITFSFMLNEKGKAYDPKMIEPLDDELLHAIEDMLKIMPPWQMKGHKSYGPIIQTINITY